MLGAGALAAGGAAAIRNAANGTANKAFKSFPPEISAA
jgi:hypothetical protein